MSSVVGRGEAVGGDHHDLVEDEAVALAREIEVAVVGEVDRRRLVGRRRVVQAQFVRVGERVDHRHVERPRVPLVAVRAAMGECHRLSVLHPEHVRLPHDLVEADVATVQVVRPVVGGEVISPAVQCERAFGDPVADAADRRAEVRRAGEIRLQRVEPQHDVGRPSGLVGDDELGERGAVSHDLRRHAVAVGEGVDLHGCPVLCLAECGLRNRLRARRRSGLAGGERRRHDDRRGDRQHDEDRAMLFHPCLLPLLHFVLGPIRTVSAQSTHSVAPSGTVTSTIRTRPSRPASRPPSSARTANGTSSRTR